MYNGIDKGVYSSKKGSSDLCTVGMSSWLRDGKAGIECMILWVIMPNERVEGAPRGVTSLPLLLQITRVLVEQEGSDTSSKR